MFTHSYSRAIANVLQWINTISVLRWLQKHSDDEDVSSICWQRVPSCGTTDGGTANAKKSITFIALNKSSRCVIVVWVSGYFCRILLLDPSWHCHQEWKLTIVPHASVIELWLILGTSALFACPVSHLPLFLFFHWTSLCPWMLGGHQEGHPTCRNHSQVNVLYSNNTALNLAVHLCLLKWHMQVHTVCFGVCFCIILLFVTKFCELFFVSICCLYFSLQI